MTKEVQFRRGTSSDHSTFTGAAGEITINTDRNVPVVHNGTTAGGFEVVGLAATQTITNKDLRIGTATSTGTANQRLQVVGGAYVSGSIGIGTTNPITSVHISDGNGGISTALYNTDYLTISAQNTAPGFNIIAVGDTSTYRGVFKATRARGTLSSPTLPSVDDNTFSLLGAIFDGTTNYATAAINMDVDGTVGLGVVPQRISFWTGTGSTRLERARIQSTGEVLIGSASSTATASQRLQVTGGAYVSGNLGVGVTNPTSAISVQGNVLITGVTTSSSGFVGNVTGNVTGNINSSGVSTFSNGPIFIGSATSTGTASQPLQVTGGGYVSGNLGIGTTNPSTKLDVGGEITARRTNSTQEGGQITFTRAIDDAPAYSIDVYNDVGLGLTAKLRFIDNVAGAERAAIDKSGNLLIGIGSSTGTASQLLQVNSGGYFNGNVGIATTNPTAEFHIVGLGTTTPSSAPIKVSVASTFLLATPEADAFEYDNVLLYHTNNDTTNGNKRALIPEIQFVRRTSDLSINDTTSPGTSFFGATTRPALLGGYIYEIEGLFYVTKVSNSGTITIQFSLSTGNFTFATFHAPTGGVTSFVIGGTTSPVNAFTTGNIAGGTTNAVFIKGLLQPASNSRLDVLAFSSTATFTALTNSYIKLTCMGTGGNIGNIA